MNSTLAFVCHVFLGAVTITYLSSCAPPLTAGGDASGTGSVGGAGGGGGCSASLTSCYGECVDLSTNPGHCGTCDTACEANSICVGGTCQATKCIPNTIQVCYSGPIETQNVGVCKGGMQTCAADGQSWGACIGEVLPTQEKCFNGMDEDCNGNDGDSTCLVATDLVARYFLDEAASGQLPTALDSAPTPLHLPITLGAGDSQPVYTMSPTGRGLSWSTVDAPGVAKTLIDNSKVQVALDGKQRMTIELVATINEATAYNRLLELGSSAGSRLGVYTLSGPSRFAARLNAADVGLWNTDFPSMGRFILHVVVDSTAPTQSDRVRLYLDGVLQSASGGAPPALNEALVLGTSKWISLGNNEGATRSVSGAIYYAALYANALTASEITTNVAFLKIGDDRM